MQQTFSNTALAFVSGVFWYISAHQMVGEQLERKNDAAELLRKTTLVLGGLIASAVINIVMFYYV